MVTEPLSDDLDVAMLNVLPHKHSYAIESLDIGGETVLSADLLDGLEGALDRVEAAAGVLLLRVTGNEAPAPWLGERSLRLVSKWERLLRRIERADVPVLALAERACSAVALELLLVADYRVAVQDFTISAGAAWPGMSLYRLAHQIGQARTKRLILRHTELSAAQAAAFDVLDHIAGDRATALEHIEEFVSRAPLRDFAARRRLIQDAASVSFEEALGAHLAACDRTFRRSDSDGSTTSAREHSR